VSGSNVKCELEVPQRRVLVLGDEGQLAQVTQNLVRNAVEAMPSGGIVHIRISLGLSSTVGKGEEACIEVSDAGTGIDPALLDRVFVPFFSTKPSGSGLGLAAAYSIVHSHGGRITVTSRLHQGTTFTVFLPVADVADEVTPPAVLIPAASGRVLVMDDQAVIRHVVEKALREVGCDTCLTSNGEEAIAAYREALIGGRPFGAAILDMTIPGGMGGREVAAAILALDPAAKLIVSSGYSENAVMSDHRSHGFRAVLPKPYSAEQLRAVVARVLQAPSG
jgi:two-component system cell cycle sensor histidine kinase/response regulator CckA